METYANPLLRTIGKVYYLPKFESHEYRVLRSNLINIMKQLRVGQINRQEAATQLQNNLVRLQRKPTTTIRAEERISTILKMVEPINLKPENILDIGAGNSEITIALKIHYNLPTENVFAIDVKLPQVVDVTPLTYIDKKIPLPDNSIDLIIIFMVLHHIPPMDRDEILSEIARVLSPNGVVIIREHDDSVGEDDGSKDTDFYIFLDLLHIFWYIASNETPDPLYLMSRNETQALFKQVGLYPGYYITYPDPNPQHIYHELYIKSSDTEPRLTLQAFIDK